MMVRLLRRANLMAETMSCSVFGVTMMAGGEVMRESDQRERILVAGEEGEGMEKEVRREVDLNESAMV
jgi:tRNA G18 (ribose-2'-O)-methylase SpoU